MADREKYIEVLSKTAKTMKEFNEDVPIKISLECIEDILELLKDQEDLGTELTNAVELIHKKNERIEKLLKEREAVVRCKDCKHGKIHGIDVECVAHEEVSYDPEPWHPLDWFCADGERKSD